MHLTLDGVEVSYGKKKVLNQISMAMAHREVVALVGHNGAGKTTLLKAILGLIESEKGQIKFEGDDITHLPPHLRVGYGIVYCPQGGEVFKRLTVVENLEVAGHRERDSKKVRENVEKVLSLFPALKNRCTLRGGVLSGGERQMLSLGMSLMLSPKLFLIDEPSGGLSPLYVDKVFESIRRINEQFQTTILLVEQNVNHALGICQKVYVLRNGHIVYQGNKNEVKNVSSEFMGF
ncbi:MAG: ABC transporter ATP-binding protein [Thermodesulfobacteriota bacterium]|nr:ABC transporter ATP-binding protein [Thermodesulfobacteriota bacterium]